MTRELEAACRRALEQYRILIDRRPASLRTRIRAPLRPAGDQAPLDARPRNLMASPPGHAGQAVRSAEGLPLFGTGKCW